MVDTSWIMLDTLAERLTEQSWAIDQTLFSTDEIHRLRMECLQHWQEGRFHEAKVGRAEEQIRRADVRSDWVHWLDPDKAGAAVTHYFERLATLRDYLNRSLYLGLVETEAHFAVYPKGASYTRHIDRFRDDDSRVISVVLYLNPIWSDAMGGQLRLYLDPECQTYCDVLPSSGTLVVFLSDQVWHEVLPTECPRLSITSWFRRRPLAVTCSVSC